MHTHTYTSFDASLVKEFVSCKFLRTLLGFFDAAGSRILAPVFFLEIHWLFSR